MVLSNLLAPESVVGVDIGTSSIKLLTAETSRQGHLSAQVTICPTPPESVKEGIVVNVPEVASAIQFAMRSAGMKASSGIAAISGPGVLVRHVQLPKMTEQMLRKSIRFEAGKFISASIEDCVVEFQILGDAEEPGQMKVMLVAAPTQMIESRVQVLSQAALEPLAIDVEAFATFRSLIEYNPEGSQLQGAVALLDMGANHTEINLVYKGNLLLTRTVPIAGVSLTNAVKNAENCSEEEAEQRKYTLDLSELVESQAPTAAPTPGLRVVQSLIDEVLREIRRSINYFQSQLPEASADTNVSRIILTGGSARLKGLAAYTKSRLNIEASIANPALAEIMGLSADGDMNSDDVPLLSVAFGLGVKEISVPEWIRSAA